MNSGVVLIAVGGFLLGGAYSVTQLENDGAASRRRQLVVAAVLTLLALYLVVVGIIRIVQE
ncbi:MAG: hypothetical protein H0U15_10750 [Geodermatophilaceae bacterium]|nr:hypothetical protein [Geodermatophilaceae bacterium]